MIELANATYCSKCLHAFFGSASQSDPFEHHASQETRVLFIERLVHSIEQHFLGVVVNRCSAFLTTGSVFRQVLLQDLVLRSRCPRRRAHIGR